MKNVDSSLAISDEQSDEFRDSALELAAINVPSVVAGIYSEIDLGHSAQVSATTVMEASDVVFSLGVFYTEKLDRLGKHERALRIRQAFAAGHVTTASLGVYWGANDIVNNNVPSSGNMVVAGTVAGASALSLWRDKRREMKREKIESAHNQVQNTQAEFHGLNAEFVKDMKRTNIAEVGGGIFAVLSQKYLDDGSALFTIIGSMGVIGIMGRNIFRQQRVFKNLSN